MFYRHLITRAKEHFNLSLIVYNKVQLRTIFYHVTFAQLTLNNFTVLRRCNLDFHTENYEALLIRKYNPSLYRQFYANGASYLLKIF